MSLSGTNSVSAETGVVSGMQEKLPPTTILMLLTNAYEPDPRVRQEALSLMKMGCRVRLLAWDRDRARPAAEIMEGVEVERIFLNSRHGRGTLQILFYFMVYLRMFWRSWRTRFDVIHCHDLDTLPLGWLLGGCKRKPVIFDAHEIFPEMLKGSVGPLVHRGLLWLEKFLVRRTDIVITVGQRMKDYFLKLGANRVEIVGNWKRLDEFSRPEREIRELRQRHGIPPGALVVAFIANLSKERKLEELLRAVAQCPDVYAFIGGKGILEPLARQWAAKNPRIIYLGFVPAQEIPAYTCAADVIYYGFDPLSGMATFSAPHKLFEALAAGKPIITGDFGEIADVVRRTACGIVLPSYAVDVIQSSLKTLRSEAVRAHYGRNALDAGRREMHWGKAEEILYLTYSKLSPRLIAPVADSKSSTVDAPATFAS